MTQTHFRVVKSLNSSVVLAADAEQHEWLLLGKGIGYGRRPGDTVDPQSADRAFVPLAPPGSAEHLRMLSCLTPERLTITEEIVTLAEKRLQLQLNPFVMVALTDHLAFALDRAEAGAPVMPMLSWELSELYPDEFAVATEALSIIEKHTGIRMPSTEAVSITLHLVNAEQAGSDMSTVARWSDFLDWLVSYVEQLASPTDLDTPARTRLVRHARGLCQRIAADDLLNGDVTEIYESFCAREVHLAAAVQPIITRVRDSFGVELPTEELLHMALYVRPLIANCE